MRTGLLLLFQWAGAIAAGSVLSISGRSIAVSQNAGRHDTTSNLESSESDLRSERSRWKDTFCDPTRKYRGWRSISLAIHWQRFPIVRHGLRPGNERMKGSIMSRPVKIARVRGRRLSGAAAYRGSSPRITAKDT